jgi:hypothetical protein
MAMLSRGSRAEEQGDEGDDLDDQAALIRATAKAE